MADAKKPRGTWLGHPTLHKDHEHELHLAAALHEFQGGLPRHDAEQRALEDYRREHHARAAAHHFGGIKAAHSVGDTETAQKHHALYSLHVKALGEDPMGPVPESVRKFHGSAGTDEKQKRVYNFKGHDADEFLVQPVTKAELDMGLQELRKATSVEQLRAATKAVADSLVMPPGVVDYLAELSPKVEEPVAMEELEKAEKYRKETCPSCGSRDTAGVVGGGEHRICRGPGCGRYYKPGPQRKGSVAGGGETSEPREGHLKLVKKATEDLKKTLEVIALTKAALEQLQKK